MKKFLLNFILVVFITGFCTQIIAAEKTKVIFVTKGDSLFVDALSKKGYDVTVSYPGTEGWSFSKLNFADIVVIGRSMSSGDFKLAKDSSWAKIEVPVLNLSAPAVRSSRLQLINSGTHKDFTFDSATDTLWSKFADTRDPIIKGLKLKADSTIDYSTEKHSIVKYGADSLEATSSAKLLATVIAPDSIGGGWVLACRWKAGVETYPGGMIPTSIWSYISISGFALTDNGLQMCVNEIETLLKMSKPDKKKIALVSRGDSLLADAFIKEGYEVTVFYPGTEDWDFSKLNIADLVVIGRDSNSGDFKNDVESWSKVESPVLSLAAPVMRSNRLKLFNSSKHDGFKFEPGTGMFWAKIADVKDPIVKGLTLTADSTIDYSSATTLVKYGADSLEATNSAKLLATVIAPDTLGGGRVLACRWPTGVETYPGSGTILTSEWSYIGTSGFSNTRNGLEMIFNEAENLLHRASNSSKKVILVTKGDEKLVNAFSNEGYVVTVLYPGTESWDFSKLNFADLVVVGRSMSSGDFKDTESWSKVETPVLFLSAPAARSSRLKLLNSKTHTDFTFPESSDILLAKIADLNDPIARGLTLNEDSTIDYSTNTHSIVKYGADSLEATSSAKLLATAIAPDTLGGGYVLACRFPAGEETYPGSAMIPVSEWSYIPISGFSNTSNGLRLIFNEAENLLRRVENSDKKVILVTKGDDLYKNALMMDGYDVEVKYPGTEGWDFSHLNLSDLVVVGRSMSSGDFKDTESWSKVEAPVIFLSAPAARSSRLKLFDSKVHTDFKFPESSDILYAKFEDSYDRMAKGLKLDENLMIDYSAGTHSLVQYGADSLEATNSAKLIATAIAPDTLGGGMVLACRWQPGVETYPGSGMILTSTWTYMPVSGSSSTTNGLQMMLNEAGAMTMRTEDAKQIIFVTKGDSLYVDALTKEGYEVTTTYPGTEDFSFSKLNFANLVIIGRSSSSGDFKEYEKWAKVKPPVFSLAAPVMRSSRLKIINSKSHKDFTFANATDTLWAKIADAADPFAGGLPLDAEQMVDFSTAKHSLVKFGADSLEATHSAKLLATAVAPDTMGGNWVLAARWQAGVETYPGSGMIPTNIWSYMPVVSDFTCTANGLKMMFNEIEYLAAMYDIPDVVPVDNITISSEGDANTLKVGYTLQMYATIMPEDASNQDLVWSVSDTTLATIDQNGLLTGVKPGGFSPCNVIATNSDGMSGMVSIFIKKVPVSVDDLGKEEVNLFYNQADDMLMITNSINVERVELYTITGRKIMIVEAFNQERLQINTNAIKRGIYIVRMKLTSNQTQGAKFVK